MTDNASIETHHGVLLNILGQGVFIIGEPGIGKSSLALECLYQGHPLIADDIAEFSCIKQNIIGHCPALLSDLLHTRELGLISVTSHFGKKAWQAQIKLDIVIQLQNTAYLEMNGLKPCLTNSQICQQSFPTLTLSIQNPASLVHRIQTAVKLHVTTHKTETQFQLEHPSIAAK